MEAEAAAAAKSEPGAVGVDIMAVTPIENMSTGQDTTPIDHSPGSDTDSSPMAEDATLIGEGTV